MSRRIRIDRIALNQPGHFLDVDVYYDEGSSNRPRGFYLSVNKIEINGGFIKHVIGQGARAFLSEAPRYNANRMETVANTVTAGHEEREQLIQLVLDRTGMELAVTIDEPQLATA